MRVEQNHSRQASMAASVTRGIDDDRPAVSGIPARRHRSARSSGGSFRRVANDHRRKRC